MIINKKDITQIKIGILGGGQLARMLVEAGQQMGIQMHVLSGYESDPAAQITRYWHQGDVNKVNDVQNFIKKCTHVTFESEFLSPDILQMLQNEKRCVVWPNPKGILELQDRRTQKEWLETNNIPSAEFVVPQKPIDVESFFHKSKNGIVLKKRRHGYDGYGTFVLRTARELKEWLSKNNKNIADYIAESFIPFERELALTFACETSGRVTVYPLVEWKAQDAKCFWVKGPVEMRPKSAGAVQLKKLIRVISQTLIRTKYVGVVSFELFQIKGQFFVNELAPRVHNSCHYSIEALNISQFMAHIYCLIEQPMPKLKINGDMGFAMVNLIGRTSQAAKIYIANEGFVHWYGKKENRKGRKMGHITTLARTPDQALRIALQLEKKMEL